MFSCLDKLEIGTSFTASLHVDEASSHLNMSKRPDAELRNIKRQEKCINTNVPKFFVIAILVVFFCMNITTSSGFQERAAGPNHVAKL